jgi:hypothetical protein
MSGWQRIGVVISVLRFFAVPSYLMITRILFEFFLPRLRGEASPSLRLRRGPRSPAPVTGSSSRRVICLLSFVSKTVCSDGDVDMIPEWQCIDPALAPPACIPRTISAGGLILAIQEHIEVTAPWHQQQTDAASAVIAALAVKWPCQHPQ